MVLEDEDLRGRIIAATMEIHAGRGFLDSIHENALMGELRNRGTHALANSQSNRKWRSRGSSLQLALTALGFLHSCLPQRRFVLQE